MLLWDARSLQSKPIHRGKEWSEQLRSADNGRLLAVASGRALQLFDQHGDGAAPVCRPCRCDRGAGVAPQSAGRLPRPATAACGCIGWNRSRSRATIRWRGACLTASWNTDGRVLACGMQDGSVHLWYVASDNEAQLPGLGSKVFATGWSANGRFLAAAAGNVLVVWDFSGKGAEGSRPIELQAHSERITALCFRPSGSWLVSAARDRRLLLWRVGAAPEPQDAHLLADDCTLLRFSRDGARLAVGDARGGMTLYDCVP